jgi:protein-disulfide isomerase
VRQPTPHLGRPLLRREFLELMAGVGCLWIAPSLALAAERSEVAVDELTKPGPLPELTLGKSDAPIAVVEYASLTCSHCADFHKNVFPQLKEKYIDTGKVYFIMREYPRDNLDVAAYMLARCAGGERTLPLISALFAKQEEWAFVRGDAELRKFAKQAGFTQESYERCLTNQKLMEDVIAIGRRALDSYGVNATPTFFVNGKKLNGVGFEDFEKVFAPMLKS